MPEIDTTVAHSARVYDYWLGGKDNFEADRALGDAMIAAIPTLPVMARANRSFMERATRHLINAGVTQFLDIGTGIPTSPNLHEIAQSLEPRARIVYVDHDPLVLAQAQALLTSDPAGATAYIPGDITDPEAILAHPALDATLDLNRPVALMLIALLMYFPDDQHPERMVAALLDALPAGSYVAISHPTADFNPEAVAKANAAANAAGISLVSRSKTEVEALFNNAALIPPGVTPLATWHPENPPTDPHAVYYYAGIAQKPQ